MKKPSLLLFALVTVAFVYSCKKKTDDNTNNNNTGSKTKLELISAQRWKISTLVSSNTDIWNTPFVAACNRDNQYKFRNDDSLVLFDMSSKCNTTDPDSTVSFYKLYDNDSKIILNVKLTSTTTLDDTADIVTLDENTLKINAEYSGLPATITFIHP